MSTKVIETHSYGSPAMVELKNISALTRYSVGAKCEKPGGRKLSFWS